MTHEMLFAGFGGQGVLLAGQLVTYAGVMANKQISWMPAYGPEMRGGTASCSVIVSDKLIGSPVVTKPDVLIAFNKPSLERFISNLKPEGVVIVNSSLCDEPIKRQDVRAIYIPFNEIATNLGNARALNMIALGAVIEVTKAVSVDDVQLAFKKKFGSKPGVVESNMQAVLAGVNCVKNNN